MRRFGGALILLALFGYGPVVVAQGPIFVPPPKTPHNQTMNLLDVGATAPDWRLTDAEGTTHTLSEYRGKVVVMDFWATWCGPCSAVMPRIQKLHEKFADKGVVVFGVNTWENSDPVALMKKKRYGYALLLKGEGIAKAYKVTTLPVVYIVGYDGKVIYCHEGVDDKNLSSVIEKYFKVNRIAKTT